MTTSAAKTNRHFLKKNLGKHNKAKSHERSLTSGIKHTMPNIKKATESQLDLKKQFFDEKATKSVDS